MLHTATVITKRLSVSIFTLRTALDTFFGFPQQEHRFRVTRRFDLMIASKSSVPEEQMHNQVSIMSKRKSGFPQSAMAKISQWAYWVNCKRRDLCQSQQPKHLREFVLQTSSFVGSVNNWS